MSADVQKQNFPLIEEDKFYSVGVIYPKGPNFLLLPMEFMRAETRIKRIVSENNFFFFDPFFNFPRKFFIVFVETGGSSDHYRHNKKVCPNLLKIL